MIGIVIALAGVVGALVMIWIELVHIESYLLKFIAYDIYGLRKDDDES